MVVKHFIAFLLTWLAEYVTHDDDDGGGGETQQLIQLAKCENNEINSCDLRIKTYSLNCLN